MENGTNWRPILIWGGLILVLILVAMNQISPVWLFAIAMIACHLGHSAMGSGGKHH